MKIALKDNERVRQIYRQSPWVLVHPLGLSLVIAGVLIFLTLRFGATGPLRYILFAIIIFLILRALKVFIIWRLNQYVITNQRILHYWQKGLFDQTVTETPHERVLNVSYKTEGMISTLIGYGDVIVQVVGLMEPIILKNIDEPMEIKDYLWEMHKRITKDIGGSVYGESDATHIQEQVGYTKRNKI